MLVLSNLIFVLHRVISNTADSLAVMQMIQRWQVLKLKTYYEDFFELNLVHTVYPLNNLLSLSLRTVYDFFVPKMDFHVLEI